MLERTAPDEALAATSPPTRRRVVFFTLVGLSMVGLAWLLAAALSAGGLGPADFLLVVLFVVTLPWSVIGFWNATVGLRDHAVCARSGGGGDAGRRAHHR